MNPPAEHCKSIHENMWDRRKESHRKSENQNMSNNSTKPLWNTRASQLAQACAM